MATAQPKAAAGRRRSTRSRPPSRTRRWPPRRPSRTSSTPPSTPTCPPSRASRRPTSGSSSTRPLQGLRRVRGRLRGPGPRRSGHGGEVRLRAERRVHARSLPPRHRLLQVACPPPRSSTATRRSWPTSCSASTPSASSAAAAPAPAAAKARSSAWSWPPRSRSTARRAWASSPRPAATPSSPALIRTTRSPFRGPTRSSRTARPMPWASGCAGIRPATRIGGCGSSAATAPCTTSASSRCRAWSPRACDIKVLVLDTGVYSNTGGQTSTASFTAQVSKLSAYGKAEHGKQEKRKELGRIMMAHGDAYVAQVAACNINHLYKAVMEANAYPGPAVIIAYAPCMPEHGIADDAANRQAKLAVESRAFPLFTLRPAPRRLARRAALAPGQPGDQGRLVEEPRRDHLRLHLLRPHRRPLRPALRQGGQSLPRAAGLPGGPPPRLAHPPGDGRRPARRWPLADPSPPHRTGAS